MQNNAGYFVEVGEVLSNKLGITNPKELEAREYDITAKHISEILLSEPPKQPNFEYLLYLHRQIFSEIYDFAGKIRQVNISKPDSPVPFCCSDFIIPESQRIFSKLAEDNYLIGLEKPDFAYKLAWLSSELNALHPFRERNDRTTRLFLMLPARNANFL